MTDLAINEQKKSLLPAVVAYSLMLVLFCILVEHINLYITANEFGIYFNIIIASIAAYILNISVIIIVKIEKASQKRILDIILRISNVLIIMFALCSFISAAIPLFFGLVYSVTLTSMIIVALGLSRLCIIQYYGD